MFIGPGNKPVGGGGGTGGPAKPVSVSGAGSQVIADYVPASPVWSTALQLQAESYFSSEGSSSVKFRGLIFLGFLLVCAIAFAQPDSTIYVKSFRGNDVGSKVYNAMQTCTSNTLVPCYLVIDPTLAATAPGTLPTLCNHCYLVDWRYGIPSGTGAITGLTSLDPTHLPITVNGQITDLNLNLVDKLDQANTHSTGTQLVNAGAGGSIVARIARGSGAANSVNIVAHGIVANGSGNPCSGNGDTCFTVAVTAGEWLIEGNYWGANTPSSTLGNSFSIAATGSSGQVVAASHITVSGTDTIDMDPGHSPTYGWYVLIQGLPSTAAFDTASLLSGAFSASVVNTITTTNSNDVIWFYTDQQDGGCAVNVPTGFTALDGPTSPGIATIATGYQSVTVPGSYSATFTYGGPSGNGCLSATYLNGLVAFKVTGYSNQTADLDEWQDWTGATLARVDANGAFNPPQVGGIPAFTPHYGALAYDTTNHCTRVYDAVNGWECLNAAGAGLTAGTNGYYRIEADGTITDYVNTGALNNNTPTSVTLPHSFPSLVASITCTDNGGRVQAGNDQPVGANIVGVSAPYGTIYVNSPATGMSAYCVVVGK